jgi:hypothetical protein
VVSVDSTSGVATANVIHYSSISVTTISYTLPTGCLRSAIVTVNPMPAPIHGGTSSICSGESTAMLVSVQVLLLLVLPIRLVVLQLVL